MHALAALLLVILSASTPPYAPPVLETVTRDGTVQATFGSSGLTGARFSPDGTKVAWAAPDGAHIADADGTNSRLVDPASTSCHTECTSMNVAWSQDGAKLLISGGGPETNALQIYSLTTGSLTDAAPRLRLVLYQALGFTAGGAPVYTRDADRSGIDPFDLLVGSRVVYRFGSSHCQCGGLRLSPDGRHVAIAWQGLNGNVIRVIDVRNGVAYDIHGYNPAFALWWSPDSTRIAFPNRVQGSWTTETIAAGGGKAHAIGPGIAVGWARDGEALIVRNDYSQLWASGGGPERLLFHAPKNLLIDWVDAA
jgi:WD40 repeat protein